MAGLWILAPAIEVRILAPQFSVEKELKYTLKFWRYRLVAQDGWFSAIKPGFDSP